MITACYGCSSIIVPPVVNALVEQYHVTGAFQIIGVVMLVIICASAFVIKPCPVGFEVTGVPQKASATVGREYSYQEMLKEREFYLMLLILMCGVFAGMMVIISRHS